MTRENRRSTRIRKVQPVGFRTTHGTVESASKTVSANVSQGGMLLVTRRDEFPPAGTRIDLFPQPSMGAMRDGGMIPGRIVYTRISPEANLRFAGLEFRETLSEDTARSIGLHNGEDNVVDALKTLQELEEISADDSLRQTMSEPESPEEIRPRMEQMQEELDAACNEFVAATCSFVCEWAEKKILDTVVSREALSRAKGIEGLRALKNELSSLIEDYPALTDAQLNRNDLWAHRSGPPEDLPASAPYYDVENERPALWLVDELRKLMGFTGVLLVTHGYDELSKESDWSPLGHEKALVAYRGSFAISDDMTTSLRRASSLYDSLRENAADLERASLEQARAKVRKMWEDA